VLNVSDTGLTDLPEPLRKLSKLKAIVAMNNPWTSLDEGVVSGRKELNSLSEWGPRSLFLLRFVEPAPFKQYTSQYTRTGNQTCSPLNDELYTVQYGYMANPSHIPLSKPDYYPQIPLHPHPPLQTHLLSLPQTHRCLPPRSIDPPTFTRRQDEQPPSPHLFTASYP